MRIVIWDSVKGEWVEKFSALEPEVYQIKRELEDVGFRCILIGDGSMPNPRNRMNAEFENTIIQALMGGIGEK